MDTSTIRIYSDRLYIHVQCLKNTEYATKENRACGLYDWTRLFSATTWEGLKKNIKHPLPLKYSEYLRFLNDRGQSQQGASI